MSNLRIVAAVTLSLLLPSCAMSTGGYSRGFFASPVGEDGYYVSYGGGSFSSSQTSQLEWLYNCSLLALNHGYDGFETRSVIKTTENKGENLSKLLGPGTVLLMGLIGGYVGLDVQDNITLLKRPFDANAPRVFDAAAVKNGLERCLRGNAGDDACKHARDFLTPAAPVTQ